MGYRQKQKPNHLTSRKIPDQVVNKLRLSERYSNIINISHGQTGNEDGDDDRQENTCGYRRHHHHWRFDKPATNPVVIFVFKLDVVRPWITGQQREGVCKYIDWIVVDTAMFYT